MMCTGTILQFGIPKVVIGENKNFGGNEDFLRSKGVEVIVADDPDCIAFMAQFIRETPELWAEDIAELVRNFSHFMPPSVVKTFF